VFPVVQPRSVQVAEEEYTLVRIVPLDCEANTKLKVAKTVNVENDIILPKFFLVIV
jgi:hypothetical protein